MQGENIDTTSTELTSTFWARGLWHLDFKALETAPSDGVPRPGSRAHKTWWEVTLALDFVRLPRKVTGCFSLWAAGSVCKLHLCKRVGAKALSTHIFKT